MDYSREVFDRIADEFRLLTDQLAGAERVRRPGQRSPEGDNVVKRSSRMPWYEGPALLEYLEKLPVTNLSNRFARFASRIQYVVRKPIEPPRLRRANCFRRVAAREWAIDAAHCHPASKLA